MENANLGFLLSYVGVVTIVVGFSAVAYRVGHFTVMPGEARQQVLMVVLALAIGLVLGLAVPELHWSPGLSDNWVIIGLGWIGVLLFSRLWLKRWVSRSLEEQPPERRAEVDRRTTFMRGRQGRRLFAATLVSIVIWILVSNFARS